MKKLDIKSIIPFYECKGTYSYVKKKTMKIKNPKIDYHTRFTEIAKYINKVLIANQVNHMFIEKTEGYWHIRINHLTNCMRFTNLIREDVRFRKDEVTDMYQYCLRAKKERKRIIKKNAKSI